MTQDEIIRMAREAGFDPDYFDNIECSCDECNFLKEPLERFAALVAANAKSEQINLAYQQGYEEGSVHEREACAKVCDAVLGENNVSAAIRARSGK